MPQEVILGLLIPFAGTALGSALVFLMRGELSASLQRALSGFAAGVLMFATGFTLMMALDVALG